MLNWLAANWGNIVILSVLFLVVAAIVIFHVRAKKQGRSTCAGGCSGCAMQGICHEQKQKRG